MTTTEYITKPGDRWELIAYKAYGTILDITLSDGSTGNAIGIVIRANPDQSIDDILDEGLLLQIPVIADSATITDAAILPPWKS
jgi:phage tail protein X